ncbi:hypothetical protein [Roseomonas sp. WA12]
MQADRRAAIWDEVWAEYDARRASAVHPARVTPVLRLAAVDGALAEGAIVSSPVVATGSKPAVVEPRRVRLLTQVLVAVMAGVMLLTAWLVLPWLLALRLSVPLGEGDAPGLWQQFHAPAAMASLRAGLSAEVPDSAGEGATRFLSGMADRMAASWETPEGLSAWLTLRVRGGRFEGSPAPISALRSARPTGLASFRLDYGPSHGEGGVGFDIAWRGDGFRVTGVHFLQGPPAPFGSRAALIALR